MLQSNKQNKKYNYQDLEFAIKSSAEGEDDIDAETLMQLSKLVKEKKWIKAFNFYRNMDTFVREALPDWGIDMLYDAMEAKKFLKQINKAKK